MQKLKSASGDLVILSPRERSVVRLVIRGDQNKEIAYTLGIAQSTVTAHISILMQGLGIHNRTGLCAWALSHPLALAGFAVTRQTHPEGCKCGSPYCSALSLIDRAA